MPDSLTTAIAAALAFAVGYLLRQVVSGRAMRSADEILADARRDADDLKRAAEVEAEKAALARERQSEKDAEAAREKLRDRERLVDRREAAADEAAAALAKREALAEDAAAKAAALSDEARSRRDELDRLIAEQRDELFRLSGLDREAAEQRVLDALKGELAAERGALILQHEADLKDRQETLAREIVGMAVQRLAGRVTAETTTSTVDIPNEEMKGRVIGREGRNIRAFEEKTGVDLIVDDTPGVVVVSGFDAVRREVARAALERLIQDGRIHPARIEEVVAEAEAEMDARVVRAGEEALAEADVPRPHAEVVRLLGRLRFRTSYSQNVQAHSIEVARLTALMAEQLGLDAALARRCGLYHDLGKAADHDAEGGHPKAGADILKRCGEPPEVVHAALGHHDDVRPAYPYTVLTAAADAVSAARPGARGQTLDRTVQRLEELEALALGFPGVERAHAVQAGRQVRVIVDPESVGDREAAAMARDLAAAVEQSMTYPGEVKVTVLRETRAVGVAR